MKPNVNENANINDNVNAHDEVKANHHEHENVTDNVKEKKRVIITAPGLSEARGCILADCINSNYRDQCLVLSRNQETREHRSPLVVDRLSVRF